MNIKRYMGLVSITFTWLILVYGCAGYYQYSLKNPAKGEISIENLEANWTDYFVYYTKVRGNTGNTALIFNPKNDDKVINAKYWSKVLNNKTLSNIMATMKSKGYTNIYRIVGPEGQLFGYMIAARCNLVAKVVDEKTLDVYDFVPPPERP
jgi:hypothetical protein